MDIYSDGLVYWQEIVAGIVIAVIIVYLGVRNSQRAAVRHTLRQNSAIQSTDDAKDTL